VPEGSLPLPFVGVELHLGWSKERLPAMDMPHLNQGERGHWLSHIGQGHAFGVGHIRMCSGFNDLVRVVLPISLSNDAGGLEATFPPASTLRKLHCSLYCN
jgi:hypothetical protein